MNAAIGPQANQPSLLKAGRTWWRDAMAGALVAFPLVAVAVLGIVIVTRVESTLRQQVIQSLETTLRASHEALRIWANERQQQLRHIAGNRELRALVGSAPDASKRPLHRAAPTSLAISAHLDKLLSGNGAWHYFIIDTTLRGLTSKEKDATTARLIARQRPDLMNRLFAGEAVLIPPIKAESKPGTHSTVLRPAMFAATPITSANGSILAALMIRIDPLLSFSEVAHVGRIGASGETYFFDRETRMLTASRFTDQLRRIGLIPKDASSILTVSIRNPGVDLTRGEVPTVPIEQRPPTLMARSAIVQQAAGHSAIGYRDYRGVWVLGAWLWDKPLGIGLATEIDENEALAAYHTTRDLFMGALALTVIIAGTTLFGLLTLRWKTEQRIRTLAMFPDKNPMPVLRIDNPLTVGYANGPARRFLGLIQDADGILAPPEWRAVVTRIFKDGRHRSLEIEQDGAIYSFVLTPIPESGIIYAYGQDVTQQKWAEGYLRELSIRDSLTGLANRRHFDEFLDQQWRQLMRSNARIALLFIDIDHFKGYNDRYGHQAGDACLKKIAAVIAGAARRAGDLAARYGGEEFVVVLAQVERPYAQDTAETLRRAVENLAIPHQDSKTASYVTVSIGLVCAKPDAALSASRLLEAADKALYRAKSRGRNRVEFATLKPPQVASPQTRKSHKLK
ncbi:GGDEF domain-containing protein [Nitrococcus mobilis]|uniref:diguanylate cyclase n=1 Tax=Nitrococcus mobilis Nb-231 TaxID=314278 RepID=A4BL79_9GAMM|nr:diguanylate cyclase [Nitrococcus mobilis]EAR23067.1 putative diguanylate cyclase [Nitrococcus mobilis Nb-231]